MNCEHLIICSCLFMLLFLSFAIFVQTHVATFGKSMTRSVNSLKLSVNTERKKCLFRSYVLFSMILLLSFYKLIFFPYDSLMLGKLLRGIGMRRTSISFLLRDGRWAIFSQALLASLVWSCDYSPCVVLAQALIPWYTIPSFTYLLQIYDPTKKWERYTIHGDWFNYL